MTRQAAGAVPWAIGYALLWSVFLAAPATGEDEDEYVVQTPEVVAAGTPFTVDFNITRDTFPPSDCLAPGECAWDYFRTFVQGSPRLETEGVIIWETQCRISSPLIRFSHLC